MTAYSNVVLADKPSGYWRLGEASGNFADSSGNSCTGTVTSGVFTYGVAGGIVNDNNKAVTATTTSGATVAVNAALPTGDIFSIEFWFKRSATQGATQVFIAQKAGGFQVFFASNNALVAALAGGANFFATLVAITDTTTWHHFVLTKNGSVRAGYFDGALMNSGAANQTIAAPDATLYLMNNSTAAGGANQSVDEIAVYTYPLTPLQIGTHYQAGHFAYTYSSPILFSALPTSPRAIRDQWNISDSVTATPGAVEVGGGTLICPVYWNGTNWIDNPPVGLPY